MSGRTGASARLNRRASASRPIPPAEVVGSSAGLGTLGAPGLLRSEGQAESIHPDLPRPDSPPLGAREPSRRSAETPRTNDPTPTDCLQLPVTFEPFETDGDFEIYRNFKPELEIVTFEDSSRFSMLKIRLHLNVSASPP